MSFISGIGIEGGGSRDSLAAPDSSFLTDSRALPEPV